MKQEKVINKLKYNIKSQRWINILLALAVILLFFSFIMDEYKDNAREKLLTSVILDQQKLLDVRLEAINKLNKGNYSAQLNNTKYQMNLNKVMGVKE